MYGTRYAAVVWGVSPTRIAQIANQRRVGRKVGRDWVFTKDEVRLLRPRPPGRPKMIKWEDE